MRTGAALRTTRRRTMTTCVRDAVRGIRAAAAGSALAALAVLAVLAAAPAALIARPGAAIVAGRVSFGTASRGYCASGTSSTGSATAGAGAIKGPLDRAHGDACVWDAEADEPDRREPRLLAPGTVPESPAEPPVRASTNAGLMCLLAAVFPVRSCQLDQIAVTAITLPTKGRPCHSLGTEVK